MADIEEVPVVEEPVPVVEEFVPVVEESVPVVEEPVPVVEEHVPVVEEPVPVVEEPVPVVEEPVPVVEESVPVVEEPVPVVEESVPVVEDEDLKNFNDELNFIDNAVKSVNILDQLPSYNYLDNKRFIDNLTKELNQQKAINTLLLSNSENVKNYIDKVKVFSDNNASKIEYQLSELKLCTNELKSLILQNAELKEKYSEINDLTNNEQYVSLARNIQEIKIQKQDILEFLKKFNVVAPQLYI